MYSGTNIAASFNLAAYVLYMYDYALTLGREVDLFWRQPRRTWAFALFVANRYVALFGRIPAFMVNFVVDSGGSNSPTWFISPILLRDTHRCQSLHMGDQIIIGILQFIGSVIMMMRVYAFYDQDRRILAVFIVVGLISAGLCCWAFLYHGPPQPPPKYAVQIGCLGPIYPSQGPRYAAAWGGQLLLDALVFVFMLWKLLRIDTMGQRTFLDMVLRDGAMYFAVMTAMNVANITMFLVAEPYVKSVLSSPTNLWVLCGSALPAQTCD
ncbi:hypothetical protein EDD15DRAFT_2357858 [Pisolithus albus]|nr:hypothetical protein EDD15DRAFT_2357858 [Pisolithus albus]